MKIFAPVFLITAMLGSGAQAATDFWAPSKNMVDAVRETNITKLNRLLGKYPKKVNELGMGRGVTPLMAAGMGTIKKGIAGPGHVTAAVAVLRTSGVDLHVTDAQGNNALNYSSKSTKYSGLITNQILTVAQKLLRKGSGEYNALLNNKNTYDATPLYGACVVKDDQAQISSASAMHLLRAGADPNVESFDHVNPIYYAVKNNMSDVVREAVKQGLQIDSIPHENKRVGTLLMFAAMEEKVKPETVVALVESGADINVRDTRGHTALYIAAYARRSEVVGYLLSKNPKMFGNSEEPDCLKVAISRGATACQKMIRDHLRALEEKKAAEVAKQAKLEEEKRVLREARREEARRQRARHHRAPSSHDSLDSDASSVEANVPAGTAPQLPATQKKSLKDIAAEKAKKASARRRRNPWRTMV